MFLIRVTVLSRFHSAKIKESGPKLTVREWKCWLWKRTVAWKWTMLSQPGRYWVKLGSHFLLGTVKFWGPTTLSLFDRLFSIFLAAQIKFLANSYVSHYSYYFQNCQNFPKIGVIYYAMNQYFWYVRKCYFVCSIFMFYFL